MTKSRKEVNMLADKIGRQLYDVICTYTPVDTPTYNAVIGGLVNVVLQVLSNADEGVEHGIEEFTRLMKLGHARSHPKE